MMTPNDVLEMLIQADQSQDANPIVQTLDLRRGKATPFIILAIASKALINSHYSLEQLQSAAEAMSESAGAVIPNNTMSHQCKVLLKVMREMGFLDAFRLGERFIYERKRYPHGHIACSECHVILKEIDASDYVKLLSKDVKDLLPEKNFLHHELLTYTHCESCYELALQVGKKDIPVPSRLGMQNTKIWKKIKNHKKLYENNYKRPFFGKRGGDPRKNLIKNPFK